jgi:hypothetical protein
MEKFIMMLSPLRGSLLKNEKFSDKKRAIRSAFFYFRKTLRKNPPILFSAFNPS